MIPDVTFGFVSADDGEGDIDVAIVKCRGPMRLIVDTPHGQFFVDVRPHDVNAFVLGRDGRRDFLLIPRAQP